MKLLLAITALAVTCLAAHDPHQPRTGHTVQVLRRHTTLLKVLRAAPYANTSSVPLPSWNASAAFTFFPSNSSTSNSSAPAVTQAQNATAPKSSGGGGLVGGLLSGLLGPITSGVLGPVTSGLLNNSGGATGLLPRATSAPSLSMPTMSSLSLSLLSSVRWPNSTGVAAPTGQGNGTRSG